LPLYCGWRYFPPEYKPRISGILLSAYALAPIFSSIVAKRIINPDNLSPSILYPDIEPKAKYFPPAVADNIPKFFTVFGLGTLALGTLGILLITDPLPTCEEEDKEFQKLKDD